MSDKLVLKHNLTEGVIEVSINGVVMNNITELSFHIDADRSVPIVKVGFLITDLELETETDSIIPSSVICRDPFLHKKLEEFYCGK